MSINIGPPQVDELKPRIAVIGVGGAGGNAIANMIAARVEGVDFIVANTDAQALNASPAERRIQLGTQITQGLGAGSRPEVGRAAAEESIAQVEEALNGAHMCFVAAGMGGGTGTGAAPVIAKAARDRGILTVGVVTKPFTFEGQRRMRSADAGIAELQDHVDTLIVIPNQNLFLVANPNTTFKEAFTMADEVLQQGVRGITDLMVMPGLINLDFADVRSVMREMGKAMMGTGEAEGDGRALEAAQKAIANPLLDGVSMAGAKGVIISITGGEDMRLMEVDEAANHIRELVDPDANIIWGSAFNDSLDGKIRVSVVATGIDSNGETAAQASPATRSFSFAPARTAAPAPVVEETIEPVVAEEPVAEAAPATDNDPAPGFSLNDDVQPEAPAAEAEEEPMVLSEVAATYDDTADELVLGQPEAPVAEYRPAPSPAAPAAESPARGVGGGTLFERMSRLSRGSTQVDGEEAEKEDGVDIPRFLGRQNNQ
ncbi:cell division protein FtsZ [Sphingopyxis macrogoltabida]|uniref:Cell division protein FtsZ n=1 Tax=Sphingopyxis macrogoltabida TaxID=33050 RepID=A0A0N9UC13_SPHMC|nr:cell division protein FtsZ [Sphingopyxis macrogoltabida]ALH81175.1 cell division protein FtsZ [Sphingopyxis macrogoltabida]